MNLKSKSIMQSMKERTMKNAAWLLLSALAAPAALADVKNVTVEGEAAIIEGDPALTEKNARRDARRKAVEQGAGVLVQSNTIVRNFQMVADEIATSAKGVIVDEQWGALTDGETKTTKKIKLTAKVSPEAIESSICTVVKANHDPKISIVFVEKVGDEQRWTTERGIIEAMFTEAFLNSCFTIVESGVKVTEVSANGDLPQSAIKEIVENSNAQYVLLGSGKVIKSDGKNTLLADTRMNSYSIVASVKLINVATNEVEAVATKNQQILGISPENALKAASTSGKGRVVVDDAMNDLLKKVAERWTGELVNAGKVQVVVKNVPNYGAAKAFKELCEKALNGETIEQRDVKGGSASFDITVEGGSDTIAGAIEGKKAGKYTVEVVEVARGKVILKLN
jgi:hypothetical protein